MRAIAPSITLQFNQYVRKHIAAGKSIISLGLGEAEVNTPPHIVEAGVKALRDGRTRYSNSMGLPALREALAVKLRDHNSIPAKADEIIVTPGAKNALYLACLALLEPEDEVILIRPCYVSNAPILELALGGVVIRDVNLKLPNFDMDLEKIQEAVNDKSKILFLNSPNNPSGRMIKEHDLDFLVNLMTRYPNLYLLSDEVYDAMVMPDKKHLSPASIESIRDRVLTVGGFSKTYFMTGWRVGYLHAHADLIKSALLIHQHINTNTAEFVQYAALAALEGPQDSVIEYVKKLEKRREAYESAKSKNSVLSGTMFEGGYFSFINVSASGLDGDAFAVRLLAEENVAVVPGASFGKIGTDYCRLSFVNSTELFNEGLMRIVQMLKRMKEER
ncbi:MAG: aminotransferase class I/II-fold pyridoxal phosphate-dependent enzyme [Negativicutes bacterium]|nr:aminotransferase class I/II-fold pyridoxal phosphate-dependent enzyme [Negativicutes bacterium]